MSNGEQEKNTRHKNHKRLSLLLFYMLFNTEVDLEERQDSPTPIVS